MKSTISVVEYRDLTRKKKKNKYNNKKTRVDNILFDSKDEARRYKELRLLVKGDRIHSLKVHPRYNIIINKKNCGYVELDFEYYDMDREQWVYEDVKGRDNPMSRFKRKVVEASYDFTVEIIKY